MATFALTPAQNVNEVLDFDDKAHRAIYEKAVEKLKVDPFDCEQTQLVDFMSALAKKAHDFGWVDRVMKIPLTLPEVEGETEYVNILTQHAQISFDTIKEYEQSYVSAETRERQDMHCLYTCIMNSLSQEGRLKVLPEKEKYTILTDPEDPNSEPALSGNLLLKVVLMKSTVDNRSGAYSIRMQLSDLTGLISKIGFNIEKFNLHVKGLIEDLNRRGETSDDVTFNVIKAYKEVPVKEFVTFVDRLKDDADDKDDESQYTPQYVMDKAENKYKILVNEKTWDTKMTDQDAILALKAEINKLKKQSRKKTSGGGRGNPKKPNNGKKKVDISRKPKDIHKPVKIDGKDWYWCSSETGGKCHGALRRHNPTECKGIAASSTDTKKRTGSNATDKKKRLKLKANETIVDGGASDSDTATGPSPWSDMEDEE
jgi:hypothetical protein